MKGETIAFLAAIPIPARQSWYLIDTIRTPSTPNGATELLLLEAMKSLKALGVHEATMGVAPLSGLGSSQVVSLERFKEHRLIYKIMSLVFSKGNLFYNFEPLFNYKMKFKPTTLRPAFLIYRDVNAKPKLSVTDLVSLSQAWLPKGMAHAAGVGFVRMLSQLSLSDLIKTQLRPGVIVRSVPPSWGRLIYRCRITVAMIVLNFLGYVVAVGMHDRIPADTLNNYGFSLAQLYHHPLIALICPPFLHFNAPHLMTNLLSMVVIMGGLEYLGGSTITALCFFTPLLIANPVTFWFAYNVIKPLLPGLNENVLDVGASLGTFGSLGGLYWFLRYGTYYVVGFSILFIAFSAVVDWRDNWVVIDHVVALAIGLGIGRWFLGD